MGGSWRINLFFGVSPDSVHACYKRLHPNLVENREELIEKPTGWLRFWAARDREDIQIFRDIQDISERACQVILALLYRPLFKVLFLP